MDKIKLKIFDKVLSSAFMRLLSAALFAGGQPAEAGTQNFLKIILFIYLNHEKHETAQIIFVSFRVFSRFEFYAEFYSNTRSIGVIVTSAALTGIGYEKIILSSSVISFGFGAA